MVTPMATLNFDPVRGRLELESAHPPFTTAEVQEKTAFDLGALDAIPATPVPTDAELAALRGPVRSRMIETGTYGEWARNSLAGV